MSETCSPATSQAPASPSPFLFILNQLEAAERAAKAAAEPPPKRPRGRPPKVVEPPLLPGAFRHVLSDEDSAFDRELLKLERLTAATAPKRPQAPSLPASSWKPALAVIAPCGDGKHVCVYNGAVIGTSKHKDYWEYHYARGDLRSAQSFEITKFVRVDEAGAVEAVALPSLLKTLGQKGGYAADLTMSLAEQAEIRAALEHPFLRDAQQADWTSSSNKL